MFKTSWQMGKHLTNGDSENHLKARSFRLEQWLNIILCLRRTSQGSINSWNIPRICIVRGGNLEASEVHARRLNAKEVITPKTGEHFIFPNADGSAKLSGRDWSPRIRSKAGPTCKEGRCRKTFREIREQEQKSSRRTSEVGNNEPRVQPYVPKEETYSETKDNAEARNDFWGYDLIRPVPIWPSPNQASPKLAFLVRPVLLTPVLIRPDQS